MLRPTKREGTMQGGAQSWWPEGIPTIDGQKYRAQLIKSGALRELGHGLPYLPISGPYTPRSGD